MPRLTACVWQAPLRAQAGGTAGARHNRRPLRQPALTRQPSSVRPAVKAYVSPRRATPASRCAHRQKGRSPQTMASVFTPARLPERLRAGL